MTSREFAALDDAARRPAGWALFKRKTTERCVSKGWFEPAQHPVYGAQFKITAAGMAAWDDECARRRALFRGVGSREHR